MFDRRGSRKYLNHAERRAYFKVTGKEKDAVRRLFCLTLFYTGCRITEALNVTPTCIDLADESIVFETLKQRKRGVFRSVPIPEKMVRSLGKLALQIKPGKRLWKFSRTTAYRMVKSRMKEARIAGAMASPKGLRHGFGVACVAEKISLPTIKKWMGHTRIEITAMYLEVLGNEERNLARRLWKYYR